MAHVVTFHQLTACMFGASKIFETARIAYSSKFVDVHHRIIGQMADAIETTGKDSDDVQIDMILNNANRPDDIPKRFLAWWKLYRFQSENSLTLPVGITTYCKLSTFAFELNPNDRSGCVVRLGFTEKLDPAIFNQPDLTTLPTAIPSINVANYVQLPDVPAAQLSDLDKINAAINKVKAAMTTAFFVGNAPITLAESLIANAFSVVDLLNAFQGIAIDESNYIIDAMYSVINNAQQIAGKNTPLISIANVSHDTPVGAFCSKFGQTIEQFNELNPLYFGDLMLDEGSEVLYYLPAPTVMP